MTYSIRKQFLVLPILVKHFVNLYACNKKLFTFSPKSDTNKETTYIAIDLGIVAASKIIIELQDESNVVSGYLSSANGRFS